MIPIKLLKCEPNHHMLDMYTTPKNKTTQLYKTISNSKIIITNKSNPKRYNLLISNTQQTNFTSIIITQHNNKHLPKYPNPNYDRILVDTPYTNNTTTQKNPKMWIK